LKRRDDHLKILSAQALLALSLLGVTGMAHSQNNTQRVKFEIKSLDELEIRSAKLDGAAAPPNPSAEISEYLGRRAIQLVNRAGVTAAGTPANGETIAIVAGSDFGDGTIEVNVAGLPREGAQPGVRGFVGVAFRVAAHGERYECMSLRELNGRADDQLRRNHTTQYGAYPDFPWHRLREESPGVYESYADVDPRAWTRIKILVSGATARLYVNGTEQPSLIVNDLKLGKTRGQIALWVGTDTVGYFSDLVVERRL
jgi:hypothetical protein